MDAPASSSGSTTPAGAATAPGPTSGARPGATQPPAAGQKTVTTAPAAGPTNKAAGLELLRKSGFDINPDEGRLKVTLDGEVVEWDADEFARWAAKARKESAAEKRFLEAKRIAEEAQKKTEYFSTIEAALKDPKQVRAILAEFGHKPVDLAQGILQDHITTASMTPEQQRIAELEAKNQELEQERQSREQAASEARKAAAREHWTQHYQGHFAQALQEVGIALDGSDPRALWAIQRMAHLHRANKAGLPVTDLAQEVASDIDGGVSIRLAALAKGDPAKGEGQPLLEYLEARQPGIFKYLQQAILHRYRSGGVKVQPGAGPGAPPTAPRTQPRGDGGRFTTERPRDKWQARELVQQAIRNGR